MKTSQIELTRKHKKLVIVGNGMCGKTSLLCAYKDDQFAEYHSPTVFETYVTDVPVDGRTVSQINVVLLSRSHFCVLIGCFSSLRHSWSRRL